MAVPERIPLDVRFLAPRERHPLIFQTFDSLPEGGALELINDHEPKPLLYQLQFEQWGTFEWSPLEEGPEVWRVEIRKRPADAPRQRGVQEFLSGDHDRLDTLFRGAHECLHTDDWTEAERLFSEFRTGLERHIRMEEEVLFPAFEQATGLAHGGPPEVMRVEHRQIRQGLEEIHQLLTLAQQGTPPAGLAHAEAALQELLEAHNDKEENILYPWTDRMTDERGRNDLVRAMQVV